MKRIASIFILGVAGILVISACARNSTPMPVETMQVVTVLPAGTPGEVTSTPEPVPGGQKIVTLEDSGKTIILAVGEKFLLKLGEGFAWEVSVSDPEVLSLVENAVVGSDTQGIYQAHRAGTASLAAAGDPLCLQSQPPCGMPSILVEITVLVR